MFRITVIPLKNVHHRSPRFFCCCFFCAFVRPKWLPHLQKEFRWLNDAQALAGEQNWVTEATTELMLFVPLTKLSYQHRHHNIWIIFTLSWFQFSDANEVKPNRHVTILVMWCHINESWKTLVYSCMAALCSSSISKYYTRTCNFFF